MQHTKNLSERTRSVSGSVARSVRSMKQLNGLLLRQPLKSSMQTCTPGWFYSMRNP